MQYNETSGIIQVTLVFKPTCVSVLSQLYAPQKKVFYTSMDPPFDLSRIFNLIFGNCLLKYHKISLSQFLNLVSVSIQTTKDFFSIQNLFRSIVVEAFE